MDWGFLVAAVITALIAGAACYALKIRNTYAVLLVQFLASFAVLSLLAFNMADAKGYTNYGKLALICAGISLFLFGIETVLRKTIGPLENRKPAEKGRH